MTHKHDEAFFSTPIKGEMGGGTHIMIEIIPKSGETIYALKTISQDETKGDILFPKDLMHFGENFDEAVRRIVHKRLACVLDGFYIGKVKSQVDPDGHWALTIVLVAEVVAPKAAPGTRLERFTESTLAHGIVGWAAHELRKVLEH